jgi:hypothetical protein
VNKIENKIVHYKKSLKKAVPLRHAGDKLLIILDLGTKLG